MTLYRLPKFLLLWFVLWAVFAYVLLRFLGPEGPLVPKLLFVLTISYGLFRLSLVSLGPRRVWSLQMFWLYSLFILLIPGLIQFSNGTYYWNDWGGYTADSIFLAALILVTGTFCVDVGYMLTARTYSQPISPSATSDRVNLKPVLVLFTLIAVIWSAWLLAKFGIDFFIRPRGVVGNNLENVFSKAQLGLVVTLNSALICALLITTFYFLLRRDYPTTGFSLGLFAVVFGLNFIMRYPGSISRFALLGTLLALLFVHARESRLRWDFGYFFALSFPISLYVFFRFLGGTNRGDTYELARAWEKVQDLSGTLTHADFDGFQMTVLGVRYVNEVGYTWGSQILSGLLFFVPRSIWSGKADATGPLLAKNESFISTNLSSPIYVEAYLDFTMLGTILIGLAAGWIIAQSDRAINSPQAPWYIVLSAVVFAAFLPILMRGSLLAVISSVISIIFYLVIMGMMAQIKLKQLSKNR